MAHHVLSMFFKCHQSPQNFNNNIGLPLTILGAAADAEIIVAEIGSSYPGEIAYLTGIAQPDIAVITSINLSHLNGLGSFEAIVREKMSIAEHIADGGVLLINGDCEELIEACRAGGIEFKTFGRTEQSDIHPHDVKLTNRGSEFTIDKTRIRLPLPGEGNIINTLAAWSVCSRLGINIKDFAASIKTVRTPSMRTELLQLGTLTVLNDCYNANPVSMKNSLDILAGLDSNRHRRKVFVCGYMAELGQLAERLHAELGIYIAESKVNLLLVIGDHAETVARAAGEAADYDLQINCFKNTVSACNNLEKFVKDYDILLVKGSRLNRLERIIEKLKELFEQS
jgi:UDP-N-acetylmuramoyl-tripeptide--D-alanyl-D-alanine ligase